MGETAALDAKPTDQAFIEKVFKPAIKKFDFILVLKPDHSLEDIALAGRANSPIGEEAATIANIKRGLEILGLKGDSSVTNGESGTGITDADNVNRKPKIWVSKKDLVTFMVGTDAKVDGIELFIPDLPAKKAAALVNNLRTGTPPPAQPATAAAR